VPGRRRGTIRQNRVHEEVRLVRPTLMVLIAAVSLLGCSQDSDSALSPALSAEAAAPPTTDEAADTVAVTGVGSVEVAPDVARITLGVEVEADDVATAFEDATAQAEAVVAALRDAGVDDERIQTARFEVRPVRGEPGPDREVPEVPDVPDVTGYAVTNVVRVTLADIGSVGDVLAAAVDAAGDAARVEGIEFGVEDATAAQERAREAAWEDARRRARQYAELAGRELGELRSVDETVGSGPRPLVTEDVPAAAAPPVFAGTDTVDVTVRAVWRLT